MEGELIDLHNQCLGMVIPRTECGLNPLNELSIHRKPEAVIIQLGNFTKYTER